MKSTSILLSEPLLEYIQEEINTGMYQDAGEVVRAGLRLLKKERDPSKIVFGNWDEDKLNEALEEGENSGYIDFDWDNFIKEMRNESPVK